MEYIKIKADNIYIEDELGQTVQLGTQFSDHLRINLEDLINLDMVEAHIDDVVFGALDELEGEYKDTIEGLKEETEFEKERAKKLEEHNEVLAEQLKKLEAKYKGETDEIILPKRRRRRKK